MPEENKKIEDIFSGIAAVAPENKSADLVNPARNFESEPAVLVIKKDRTKLIASIGIVSLIVAVSVLLGLFLWKSGILVKPVPTQNLVATPVAEKPAVNDLNVAVEVPVAALDSDHDGLSDADELIYKTNPQKADTDGDQLFDGEEIHTYKTDPLKADTDGDGHLDGEEVMGGYNPLGSGKLLNFEEAKKALKK